MDTLKSATKPFNVLPSVYTSSKIRWISSFVFSPWNGTIYTLDRGASRLQKTMWSKIAPWPEKIPTCMANAFWRTSTDLQKQTLLTSSILSLVTKSFIQVVVKDMQWRERNNKWTYEHKRMPNKYRVVWKTHTSMWIFGNRSKTLVHQPTLQTEVPPYPTALATLGLEGEVYQKFLHHFMLVYIDHKP